LDFQTGGDRALAHSFGFNFTPKASPVLWGVTLLWMTVLTAD
jgi:hypothetical protein